MKNYTLGVLFTTILIFSLFFYNIAQACTPSYLPNWFLPKITIDTNTLPAGIKLIEDNSSYFLHTLEVLNPTETPLYILDNKPVNLNSKKSTDSSNIPDLPENVIPIYKIVSNETFYWNSSKVWEKEGSGLKLDTYIINIEMIRKYGANRPKHVELPKPQAFIMDAYHGSKPISISGKITYTLNPYYDKQQEDASDGISACNSWGSIPVTHSPFKIIIFGLIAAIIPTLSYIFIRKTTRDTKTRIMQVVLVTILIFTILYFIARGAGIFY